MDPHRSKAPSRALSLDRFRPSATVFPRDHVGAHRRYPITTADANATSIVTGPDGNLWFIVLGPDSNLWFTEYGANQIARVVP